MSVDVRLRRRLGMRPRDPQEVPAPPVVRLALSGAVAGAVVRLLPSVLVLACVGLTGGQTPLWVLGFAAAVLVAWRPEWPTVPLLLGLLGVVMLAGEDRLGPTVATGGGLLRFSALVLGLHLLVRGAALSRHVTWAGLVELPVLWRALRSVLAVQVLVQGLVLATVWLRANLGLSAVGQGWLRVIVVGAVAVVVVVVVPRAWLRRRPPRVEPVIRYD